MIKFNSIQKPQVHSLLLKPVTLGDIYRISQNRQLTEVQLPELEKLLTKYFRQQGLLNTHQSISLAQDKLAQCAGHTLFEQIEFAMTSEMGFDYKTGTRLTLTHSGKVNDIDHRFIEVSEFAKNMGKLLN